MSKNCFHFSWKFSCFFPLRFWFPLSLSYRCPHCQVPEWGVEQWWLKTSFIICTNTLQRQVPSSTYNIESTELLIPSLSFPLLCFPFLSFPHFEKNDRSKEETSRHKQRQRRRHKHRSCAWRHCHSQVCSSRMHSYTYIQTYIQSMHIYTCTYICTYTYAWL